MDQLDNHALNIRKRGFRAISRRLSAIDELVQQTQQSTEQQIVLAIDKAINDDEVTPYEDVLMETCFQDANGAQ